MLNPKRHHRFEKFATDVATAERQTVAGELLGDAARAFLGRAAQNVAHQRAKNSAPIDAGMLIKARVLAGEERIDKERRDFIERNTQPIGAGEAAVNFSIDIEHGVALRHCTDFFHVEARSPGAVEK